MKLKLAAVLFVLISLFFVSGARSQIQAIVNRDIGYFIGDMVEVRYEISVPSDMKLDEKALPETENWTGEWVLLKKIEKLEEFNLVNGKKYIFLFVYQVFILGSIESPAVIPSVEFKYGKEGSAERGVLLAPPVLFRVSPLAGKGDKFKNFVLEYPYTYLILNRWSIFWGYLLIFVSLVYFVRLLITRLYVYSPFGEALKKIRRDTDLRSDIVLNIFRDAFNKKMGKAVFMANLDEFFEKNSKVQFLRSRVWDFFYLSDDLNFGSGFSEKSLDAIRQAIRQEVLSVLKILRRHC